MKRTAICVTALGVLANIASADVPAGLPDAADEGACYAQVLIPDSVEWVTRRVIDEKARFETVSIPALYETVRERHLVREASTVYKSVPAVYKTVAHKVEIEPGLTKTVTKQVVATPARVIEETVEAEYEWVEVEKLISPERTDRVFVPATYKTVERPIAKGGKAEWHQVLCETNANADTILAVQAALVAAGHPIKVDGKFGAETLAAMEAFQLKQGLPVGVLTISTVEALGVSS